MWILSASLIISDHLKTALVILLSTWILAAVNAALPRPKLYGKAIAHRDLDTRYANTKKKIVLIHNFYRARVNPPAKNMLEMSWHKGAQEAAQKWAGACQFLVHDKPISRWVEDYGSCGQNIFVSNVEVDWMFVAKAWFMENQNFTYGSTKNNATFVGHYTQMVWYNSHRVGCGFKYCSKDVVSKPYFNYVCNYCPIGNHPKRLGRPYSAGKPCEKCPGHCKYKKLCTNNCPYSDLWVNCVDLNSTWHSWLCNDTENAKHKACQATCKCPNAIR
ncbi:Cysteine-rich secretory protein 2 [Araneus ventricosus]|uniref:Cysteine-rich secretory protein 2 n=1 Tax=Araneus ventricosus TaxID=182803 RepID=A0A4Y2DHZ0_ARAVE|nr:Cysteine-rich secretory protein 2 [Araneus ventricosus]